jgi:hypothetical protein
MVVDFGRVKAYIRGMKSNDTKLTKLESFVWNNPHVAFDALATQTNRTVSAIERAYSRAMRKTELASQASVIEWESRLTSE